MLKWPNFGWDLTKISTTAKNFFVLSKQFSECVIWLEIILFWFCDVENKKRKCCTINGEQLHCHSGLVLITNYVTAHWKWFHHYTIIHFIIHVENALRSLRLGVWNNKTSGCFPDYKSCLLSWQNLGCLLQQEFI